MEHSWIVRSNGPDKSVHRGREWAGREQSVRACAVCSIDVCVRSWLCVALALPVDVLYILQCQYTGCQRNVPLDKKCA